MDPKTTVDHFKYRLEHVYNLKDVVIEALNPTYLNSSIPTFFSEPPQKMCVPYVNN